MSMKKMLAVVAAASLVAVAAPAFANPFSDVPMNHWAYDAVETLAAKGILEGYPDETFRGKKVMTRYEIASVIARMMASDKVGNEDVDQLKALVVEFGPELEALGVKVDGFDKRLAALEKNLSGWKISGELQFDYNATDGLTEDAGDKDGFEFDSARLFLHRDLANGVSFDAEWGDDTIDRYYLTAEDFFGVKGLTFRAGQFDIDFEGDDELYYGEHEDAGAFMGLTYRGAQLTKDFGLGEFTIFAASNIGDDGVSVYNANDSDEFYGARLKLNFGEKAWISLNGYFVNAEGNGAEDSAYEDLEAKYAAYWVGLGFKIIDGVTLKGAYYFEDIDSLEGAEPDVDDPDAYKIVLDVSQDALKFTSLWAEYAHYDEGFTSDNGAALYAFHGHFGDALDEIGVEMAEDVDVFFIALKQEWNEKISTFERYVDYDVDGASDDIIDWAVGIGYQYTPSLYFELAYNQIDIGDNASDYNLTDDDGSYVRFRTLLNF